MSLLSDAEKTYILHGVQEDFRVDGRRRCDYRPMELETGIVEHAFGSARLRLANTDILVSVKLEMDTPVAEQPNEGKIEFFVDCSANATPDFEGRGGEDLATEISNSLSTAYRSARALDLRRFCLFPGHKCWKMYIDILLLECGGNLYDAVSLAVKAALYNTKVPKVASVKVDGSTVEVEISENVSDCENIDVKHVPIMVTLCKIGEHCIVDPSNQEECCSSGSLLVSVSDGLFTSVLKIGAGSFQLSTLHNSLQLGLTVAQHLNKTLMAALHQEQALPRPECSGFLK